MAATSYGTTDGVVRAVFAALGIDVPEHMTGFTLKVSYNDGPPELVTTIIPMPARVEGEDDVRETKRFRLEPIEEPKPAAIEWSSIDFVTPIMRWDRDSHDAMPPERTVSGVAFMPKTAGPERDKFLAKAHLAVMSRVGQEVRKMTGDPVLSSLVAKCELAKCPGCDGRGFYEPLQGPRIPCEMCGGKTAE